MSWELRVRGDHWQLLIEHLYGSPGEHGAVLLCGVASAGRCARLLVHDVVLADGATDYRFEQGVYRLDAAFITRQALRARTEGLIYVAVHPHGGTTRVQFSAIDQASHARGRRALQAASRNASVGWLVTAPCAARGVLWTDDRCEPIDRVVVLGDQARCIHTPEPLPPPPTVEPRWDRQARIYGDRGHDLFKRSRLGIVGLGGGGSVANDLASSLGIGSLVLVDPDRVEITNLPRIIRARRRHVRSWLSALTRSRRGTHKVKLARMVARANSPGAAVEMYPSDVGEDDALAALSSCDYIILAADTARARFIANAIANQYLIPLTQIGAKIRTNQSGDVTDVYAVSRTIGTGPGCLWCNGLIDSQQLAEDSVDYRQRTDQRYVEDVVAPSVKSLNAVAAAWAVEDFRSWFTGLSRAGHLFTTMWPTTGRFSSAVPAAAHDCPFCVMAVGRGDTSGLPR